MLVIVLPALSEAEWVGMFDVAVSDLM